MFFSSKQNVHFPTEAIDGPKHSHLKRICLQTCMTRWRMVILRLLMSLFSTWSCGWIRIRTDARTNAGAIVTWMGWSMLKLYFWIWARNATAQIQLNYYQDWEELEGEEAGEEEADGELSHLPYCPVKVVPTERAYRVQVARGLSILKEKLRFSRV